MTKSQLDQHGVPTTHACPILKLWWQGFKEAATLKHNIAKQLPHGWITLSRSHVLDSFNTHKLHRSDDPPEA
eukprot:11910834-Heterocapsa_arctica.AAC.1